MLQPRPAWLRVSAVIATIVPLAMISVDGFQVAVIDATGAVVVTGVAGPPSVTYAD